MRRIGIWIGGLLIVGILIYSGYWIIQKRAADSQRMFEKVMSEKMSELYTQAQDWSTSVQLNVSDPRLAGDYKIMSEFLLTYWVQNVEARNRYLRELKQAKWDTFLDVKRLDADKKQSYTETERMLSDVRKAASAYETEHERIQKDFLLQARQLKIEPAMKTALIGRLDQNNQDHEIFLIEQQIHKKAVQMFVMLKRHQWEEKDHVILFHEDVQVRRFNALYQEVLQLNAQIEQIKQKNTQVIEKQISVEGN